MRIFLTGCDGQVGWELRRTLQPLGPVRAIGRGTCDLEQTDQLRTEVRSFSPDLIVNAAAYTAVDRAETEIGRAIAINSTAPSVLGEEAAKLGASIVHFSTDYVFDGVKAGAYDESDPTGPLSVYGRTKLAGEEGVGRSGAAHVIFRTSWVYSARGHNFLRTMLRLMREREELSVVADQVGAPTSARLIAESTAAVLARAGRNRDDLATAFSNRGGVYHLVAGGTTSWFGFAEFIRDSSEDQTRKLRSIKPVATAEYPTAAQRPANSRLSTARLQRDWDLYLPDWTEGVRLCLAEQPDGVRCLERDKG